MILLLICLAKIQFFREKKHHKDHNIIENFTHYYVCQPVRMTKDLITDKLTSS